MAKLTKKARTARAEEIAKVLEVIGDNDALPTSIEVRYRYKRDGEMPENINYLLHLAGAMDIDVISEYGKLVFRFGREPCHS